MMKSILFLISVLLVTCEDQQYALKYVTVLYDAGTAMPLNIFKNAKNPSISEWWMKCWKKDDFTAGHKGCITNEEAAKLVELTKRIQIKYSDFLPVYSEANKTKYGFVYTKDDQSSFESFYQHARIIQGKPKVAVDEPPALPAKEGMVVDGECKKRDLLLSLADYATNTTGDDKFQNFLQEAGRMTGENLTAKNYMEYISLALMEQRSFPDNSHDAKKLLIDHNDTIMAHNRMLMGQIEDSIIQNGLKLGKEIRMLRGPKFFYGRYLEVGIVSGCLLRSPCMHDISSIFRTISSNTMAMNSLLIEFGLEKYIKKAADYFPTSGKSINIELYANADNSSTFFKVVIFDPSDPQNYTDVTTDVKGCTGKDYCDFSVYDTLAMPYISFTPDCQVSDPSLYDLPTTTTTTQATTIFVAVVTDESLQKCKCDGTDTTEHCKKTCPEPSQVNELWRDYGWKLIAAGVAIFLVVVNLFLTICLCATRLSKEDAKNAKWIARTLKIGVKGLVKQFVELDKLQRTQITKELAEEKEEIEKYMRYGIHCLVNNRVVLADKCSKTPFVHANFVGVGENNKRFIATQGCLKEGEVIKGKVKVDTRYQFWAMIVQEKVDTIVMLGQVNEGGTPKCAQYWPTNENAPDIQVFGDKGSFFQVKNLGDEPMETEPHVRVTNLEILHSGGQKILKHYHWSNWPDHTAPTAKKTPFNLLDVVLKSEYPIVVHCSAGIGRTGTFIAIAALQEAISSGKSGDVKEILKEIRDSRHQAIQTARQYVYVHDVFITRFLEKRKKRKLGFSNYWKYGAWMKDMGKDSNFDEKAIKADEPKGKSKEKGKGKSKEKAKGKSKEKSMSKKKNKKK